MSHWWFCCPRGGCELFEDDYERTRGTDIGNNYTEVVGDWSLVADPVQPLDTCLKEAGTVNAVVVLDSPQATEEEMAIAVKVYWAGVPRIIVNYLNSTNYHYVQIEPLTDTTARWKFFKVTAGVHSLLSWIESETTCTLNGWCIVYVAFGSKNGVDTRVTFSVGSTEGRCQVYGYFICTTYHLLGKKMGFGNGSTTPVYFDDLTFMEFAQPVITGDKCSPCDCECCDDVECEERHCIPWTLTATWKKVGGNGEPGCNDNDGLEVGLTQTGEQEGPSGETQRCNWWQGEDGTDFCGLWSTQLHLARDAVGLDGGPPERLQEFHLYDELGQWFEGVEAPLKEEESTCDPLKLVFGPVSYRYDPYACCEWEITITE